jgi:hypothetical protein
MQPSLFENQLLTAVVHAAGALLAFGTALGLSSVAFLNKGAKVNLAWILSAVGLISVGLAQASLFMEESGFPSYSAWEAPLSAGGLLLILIGVLYARRLIRKLMK